MRREATAERELHDWAQDRARRDGAEALLARPGVHEDRAWVARVDDDRVGVSLLGYHSLPGWIQFLKPGLTQAAGRNALRTRQESAFGAMRSRKKIP